MMLNLLIFSLCQILDIEVMLYKPQAHLDIRKKIFSVRVIDTWNHLPDKVLHCSTLQSFKKHLDCYLKNRGYS